MKRQIPHTVRTSATVVAVAASLIVLGYTGQTPDGYVHTNFTGPLGLFGPSSLEMNDSDILAIGNGPSDASALASLLKTTAPRGNSTQEFRATLEAAPSTTQVGTPPSTTPQSLMGTPTAVPATDQIPATVVDEQGRVDCTGAISCLLDPKTNVTTVTYSDGTMATVRRINGMTLVAYQNINDKNQSKSPNPVAPLPPAPQPASVAPATTPSPLASVAVPSVTKPAPSIDSVPAVDPGPVSSIPQSATLPDLSAARPRVTISRPPQDYTPVRPNAATGQPSAGQSSTPFVSGAVDAVKEAVGSVAGAVGKAVGKDPNPGASTPGKRSSNTSK